MKARRTDETKSTDCATGQASISRDVNCWVGAKLAPSMRCVPFQRISQIREGIPGFICWSLGPLQDCPCALKNDTGESLRFSKAGCEHLEWPNGALTLHPGAMGECAALSVTVPAKSTYLVVAKFIALGRFERPTECSITLNGEVVWKSAATDQFIGRVELDYGDCLECVVGVLPGNDYLDSTTQIEFALFESILQDNSSIIRIDDEYSGLKTDEARRRIADARELPFLRASRLSIATPKWHRKTFETHGNLWGNAGRAHLDACFEGGIDELYRRLSGPPQAGRKNCYVILFTPRSGSTLLTECLAQTGVLGTPMELFVESVFLSLQSVQVRSGEDPLSFFMSRLSSENGVFGFEIDADRLLLTDEPRIPNIRDWEFFYLTRIDLLAQAISHYKATRFDVWAASDLPAQSPYYERQGIVDSLTAIAFQMRNSEAFFVDNAIEPARLTYEGLVANADSVISDIATRLGVLLDEGFALKLERIKQQRLSGRESKDWARQVLTSGGDYYGYDVSIACCGCRAILHGADVSKIPEPSLYPPLGFFGENEAAVRAKIDDYIYKDCHQPQLAGCR